MSERKLYVVTRRDLPPSTRAVMAVHAAADMAFRLGHQVGGVFPAVTLAEWSDCGPPIVLMTVRNRARLEAIAVKYHAHTYTDPDLDDGVCAIAIYTHHWNDDRARLAAFADAPAEVTGA